MAVVLSPSYTVTHQVGINAGSAFLIAAQLPPRYCGIFLLVWVLVESLMKTVAPWRDNSPSLSNLSALRVAAVAITLAFIALVQLAVLENALKPLTIAHLGLYALLVLGRSGGMALEPGLKVVNAVTLLNALLLFSYATPALREIFYYEHLDKYRFRSYFYEPSVAAFAYVLNVIVLMSRTAGTVPRHALMIGANLVCLAFTYSGSGFLLLGAVLLSRLRVKRLMPSVIGLVAATGALVSVLLFTEAGRAAADDFIAQRIAGILTDNYDNSVHLRFVAPVLLLSDMVGDTLRFFAGAGIGGIESYIEQLSPWYMVDFAGDEVVVINNGYVAILALFGVPLGSTLILAMFFAAARSPAPRDLKLFLLLYPFFSGFIIHAFFWLLIGMVCFRKRVTGASPAESTQVR